MDNNLENNIELAERKLANLCDFCEVSRDTPAQDHYGNCAIYLRWEEHAYEYSAIQEHNEMMWREYEDEMWDDNRGDWRC